MIAVGSPRGSSRHRRRNRPGAPGRTDRSVPRADRQPDPHPALCVAAHTGNWLTILPRDTVPPLVLTPARLVPGSGRDPAALISLLLRIPAIDLTHGLRTKPPRSQAELDLARVRLGMSASDVIH